MSATNPRARISTDPGIVVWARQLRFSAALGLLLGLVGLVVVEPGRAAIDAWPLLELDEDSTTILYPFYSREGKSVTAFPLYYRTNEGRDHHLIWPLVKIGDGHVDRIAPVWFSGEESYALFPLIYRTPESTALLIPPSVWDRDGESMLILPFYAREGLDSFYAPSVFISKFIEPGGGTSLGQVMVFPLFDYMNHEGTTRRSINVLLISGATWGENGREQYLVPLFGLRTGSTSDFTWVLNFFHSREVQFVFPIYYQRSKAADTVRWILSWRERHGAEVDASAVYPFFSVMQQRLEEGRVRHTQNILWPFYKRDEVRSSDNERISRTRRFLIFSDEQQADGMRRFSILGWPVSETIEPAR